MTNDVSALLLGMPQLARLGSWAHEGGVSGGMEKDRGSGAVIPEEIIVGPYRYRVVIEEEPFADESKESLIRGQVRHGDCVIRIMRQNPMVMWVTLWHEVLHAIDALIDGGMHEDDVERFAPALVAVLQRNPGLQVPP
jgi:hypothetical protein